MKNKARNLILLFVFVVILATIGNLLPEEKEEASQVVSQNSIIYEHGFPQAGTAAMLVTDDSERVLELESKVAQQDEQIKLLKKHIKELVAEQEQTDKLKEELTSDDWELFYRVVRAEAGANSKKAQKNIAYVILNRVNSPKWPNTVKDVCLQSGQFTCVSNGAIYKVELSDFTKQNVQEAYLDYMESNKAQGAIYFTKEMFSHTYLFTDEVGHNFFK